MCLCVSVCVCVPIDMNLLLTHKTGDRTDRQGTAEVREKEDGGAREGGRSGLDDLPLLPLSNSQSEQSSGKHPGLFAGPLQFPKKPYENKQTTSELPIERPSG